LSDLNRNEKRESDQKGRGVARGYYGNHDGHWVILRVVFFVLGYLSHCYTELSGD